MSIHIDYSSGLAIGEARVRTFLPRRNCSCGQAAALPTGQPTNWTGMALSADKLQLRPRASFYCIALSTDKLQLCQGPAVMSGIALSTDKLQLCPRASLSGLHLLCLRTSCSYAYGLACLDRHASLTSCVCDQLCRRTSYVCAYGPAGSVYPAWRCLRTSGGFISNS